MTRTSQVYDGINSHGSFAQVNRILRAPLAWRFTRAPQGVNVLFTVRSGGVSRPPYESLNLGFHVGDDPDRVRQNREAVCEAYGLNPANVTSPNQRHTDIVSTVEREGEIGAGAEEEESVFDPCDGLATSLRHVPLLLHFADCLPVVLAAGGPRPAAAVLHAGRRGLFAGVIGRGVAVMSGRYGVDPARITAALGAAIGPCCYEVGSEIAAQFEQRFGEEAIVGDDRIDLAAAAIVDLKAAGIAAESIHLLDICTSCDKNFFSYRRDGATGRHAAIAWLE